MDKLNTKWNLPDGSAIPTVDFSQIEVSPVREVEINAGPAIVCTLLLSCRSLIY
jgi:hypothetical protein